ncbi:hypothetical protein [Vibrio harveyi]|uniref:hypothetical protein n=1 Tax=Vibrio harveyi TaxID=669 RepID=UPI00067F9D8A|nr:hypothetical protein [Vibrio harveyi]
MNVSEKARGSLNRIWQSPLLVLNKKIEVSLYQELSEEVPDDVLAITEVIPEEDLEEVYRAFAPYMSESEIAPFLINYGNVVICIGFGIHNDGYIYCYDADFGCFLLDEGLDDFLSKLVD